MKPLLIFIVALTLLFLILTDVNLATKIKALETKQIDISFNAATGRFLAEGLCDGLNQQPIKLKIVFQSDHYTVLPSETPIKR